MARSFAQMIEDMHNYWGTIEENVVLTGQAELADIFAKASRDLYQARDVFYGLRQVDGRLAADPEDLVKASRILETLQGDVEAFIIGPGQAWVKDRMPTLLQAGRELARKNFVDVETINQDLVRAAFEHVSTAEKGVLKVGLQDQYRIMGTVGDDVGEWFRRTLMDAMVEGIPVEAPLGTDSLFNRLYESGRLKPQTIRAKDGRLIHRSLEQRAQAIARVENNKVINRVHEVVGEEALGGKALWKDAGPVDGDTTEICLSAAAQAPMTRQEWAQSEWGLAPRIDRQFHLCRHFMIAVREEWEDSKVIEARDRAIAKERARRAAEEKRKKDQAQAAEEKKAKPKAKPKAKAKAPAAKKPAAPAFVPAKTVEEARGRLAGFLVPGAAIDFPGMKLDSYNSILKASEDTLAPYGVKLTGLGYIKKKNNTYGVAIHGFGKMDTEIQLRKSFTSKPGFYSERDQTRFAANKAKRVGSLEKYIKTLEGKQAAGTISGDVLGEIEKAKASLGKIKTMEYWSTGSYGDDPLYNVMKHESFHAVSNSRPGLMNAFDAELTRFNAHGLPFTQYSGTKIDELFAEVGTGLDIGMPMPQALADAFRATVEGLK